MNREQAKEILLLYRPGTADAEEPEVVSAMDVARRDPELGAWFQRHIAFQGAMREKMRQVKVPSHLKAALLARAKAGLPAGVVAPPWWTRPTTVWYSAVAAACAVVLAVAFFWPRASAPSDRFANYKERMVSEVQRQYAMDWETSDMNQLRESIAARGGQADYTVPRGLRDLKLTGGGVLKWQSNPVSMVCFNRGGGQMLFLFVMKRDAVKDPPAQTPQLSVVHEYKTASWTEGDNAYVLAGNDEKDLQAFARTYLD